MRSIAFLAAATCALAATASGLAKAPQSPTARFTVVLLLEGSYTNKVVDTAGSCRATLAEKATFDASLSVGALAFKLQSGATASGRAIFVPAGKDTFTVTGNGWPENSCTGSPVAIQCTGTVGPEPPARPSVVAYVQGGKVLFYIGLGTAAFQEQPAAGGTCTDSDVFAGGGPTGVYGVGDLLDPYRTDTATTNLVTLAKLKKGATLTLVPKHDTLPSGYDVATCNGAADGSVIQSCTGAVSNLVFEFRVTRTS